MVCQLYLPEYALDFGFVYIFEDFPRMTFFRLWSYGVVVLEPENNKAFFCFCFMRNDWAHGSNALKQDGRRNYLIIY